MHGEHHLINTACKPYCKPDKKQWDTFSPLNTSGMKGSWEMGEEAEKSSRNDLTCLKTAFLVESEEACPPYLKKKKNKVERELVASKTVVLRRVLMVHSGQTPSEI